MSSVIALCLVLRRLRCSCPFGLHLVPTLMARSGCVYGRSECRLGIPSRQASGFLQGLRQRSGDVVRCAEGQGQGRGTGLGVQRVCARRLRSEARLADPPKVCRMGSPLFGHVQHMAMGRIEQRFQLSISRFGLRCRGVADSLQILPQSSPACIALQRT